MKACNPADAARPPAQNLCDNTQCVARAQGSADSDSDTVGCGVVRAAQIASLTAQNVPLNYQSIGTSFVSCLGDNQDPPSQNLRGARIPAVSSCTTCASRALSSLTRQINPPTSSPRVRPRRRRRSPRRPASSPAHRPRRVRPRLCPHSARLAPPRPRRPSPAVPPSWLRPWRSLSLVKSRALLSIALLCWQRAICTSKLQVPSESSFYSSARLAGSSGNRVALKRARELANARANDATSWSAARQAVDMPRASGLDATRNARRPGSRALDLAAPAMTPCTSVRHASGTTRNGGSRVRPALTMPSPSVRAIVFCLSLRFLSLSLGRPPTRQRLLRLAHRPVAAQRFVGPIHTRPPQRARACSSRSLAVSPDGLVRSPKLNSPRCSRHSSALPAWPRSLRPRLPSCSSGSRMPTSRASREAATS